MSQKNLTVAICKRPLIKSFNVYKREKVLISKLYLL